MWKEEEKKRIREIKIFIYDIKSAVKELIKEKKKVYYLLDYTPIDTKANQMTSCRGRKLTSDGLAGGCAQRINC